MVSSRPAVPSVSDRLPAELAVHANSPPDPTAEAYEHWSGAFRFFNERLFSGELNDCLITLARRRNALGYFRPGAFENQRGNLAHEIAMNPTWFELRGDVDTYSTLVHEMAHQWREDKGAKNRKGGKGKGGYHDIVWAKKMEQTGLMPSATGRPGGKRTGYSMDHYIIEGGPFDLACREFLIAANAVNWRDARPQGPGTLSIAGPVDPSRPCADPAAPRNTRTRFICPVCEMKAYSRSSARFACIPCNTPLVTL